MQTRRSRAREVALQLLFQKDQNPKGVARPAIEAFARERLNDDAGLAAYCLGLYDGVAKHQPEIDPKLSAVAENWRLNRMLPVDRNVLRLGAYELLFDPAGEPVPVVLDEAIELARRYGSKDSPKFVNGILDRVGRMRTPPAPTDGRAEPREEPGNGASPGG
ncbi:MAG: transcription antitermination factor NusB [Gemmataceae bacterium]|nr:transcription antitermination factor NusB [Gemmataceae bacterium]